MKRSRVIVSFFLYFASSVMLADLMDSYENEVELPKKKKEDHHKEEKNREANDHDKKHPADKTKHTTSKASPSKHTKEKSDPKNQSKTGEKKRAPVHFQGLGLTGLKKEGMVELHQKVIVTQEDFKLESDEAKIFLENETNEVKEVLAEGHVKITKIDEATGKLVKANGETAEFDNMTQLITLRGNAKVEKGEDVITGNLIYYNLKTGWIKVEKVKGVVNP